MTSNKDQILSEKIANDLQYDEESTQYLITLIQHLLKKNDKDKLRTELKELIEEPSKLESFVDWVWENYAEEDKSPEKESAKKDAKGDNAGQKRVTGAAKLAEKALNDVKEKKETNTVNVKRPAIYDEWEREKKLEEVRTTYKNAKNNQKPQQPPKQPPRNQAQQERSQLQEERKTGSILDRIKLRHDKDKGDKKEISTAKPTTRVQPEEKITKKIKPNPEDTKPAPVKKTVQPETQRPKAPPQNTRTQAPEPQVEQGIDEEAQPQDHQEGAPVVEPELSFKLKIRCKNWPACKNENCRYHHPSENCKFFPACPYGDKCLYIHPAIPCKFGMYCQRPGCAYVHPRVPANKYYGGFGGPAPFGKKKPFGGPKGQFNPNANQEQATEGHNDQPQGDDNMGEQDAQ